MALTELCKRVKDLRPGDMVDLEGDPFADPSNDNPALECEYQVVEGISHETPNCIAVWFEGFDTVGFPPNHLVRVPGRAYHRLEDEL